MKVGLIYRTRWQARQPPERHPAVMKCSARLRYVWRRAGRQKQVGETDTQTNLRRCLSTLQMTALGLGSTIGVGIYVLLGVAIRDYAGPGVILSFLGAGLVVLSNAVIYCEFGAYIPHTGASYTYMYKAVGELAAFLTGWMGLFSLTCSAATGARAWSGFIDSLFNNSIQAYFDNQVGQLHWGPPFAHSLDWMAFVFFLVLTMVVSCNIQCSSAINTILAVITTGVLVFVTFAGLIVGDVHRLADSDNGGFLPYGLGGVVSGASAAFFAFNGYDSICISAEEAKDPVKSVPRAILIELLIVTVVYCGAAVGTLCLIPYTDIDLRAPIPSAFAYHGLTWARYIVTIGPVVAMTNLSLLSLYAQSRIFYRMAKDGLLFKAFGYINPVTKVPLLGVVVCGVLVAVIALLLELKDLVRFTVLCMLFQYIILAPALINLRAMDLEKVNQEEKTSTQSAGDRSAFSRQDHLPTDGSGQPLGPDEENESLVDDGSPGQTPSRPSHSLATYSYVTAGDLGSGSRSEDHDDELADFFHGTQTSTPNSASSANYHPATNLSQPSADTILVDVGQGVSSEFSQSEDGATVLASLRNRNLDLTNGELADESHYSEDQQTHSETSSSSRLGPVNVKRVFEAPAGWFDVTMREFFRLLSTQRCLVLLVILLATLALQLGLAWQDVRGLKTLGVISTLVILILIIFLCEVLRKRCGPGKHEGFKVPWVPYLPAISCFLNMLLLVTAADYMGIIEFTVIVVTGLVVYVVMVMTQWSQQDSISAAYSIQSLECRNLLAHEDNDADSEGSV